MLLQAGKACLPEAVEAAKLQGRGITSMLLDDPTHWISLRYPQSLLSCRSMYARGFLWVPVHRCGTVQLWYLHPIALQTHCSGDQARPTCSAFLF